MKLLNKLLPIATVASAAIVAPTISSCASDGFKEIDIHTLLDCEYARTTPVRAEGKFISETEAIETYLKDVKSNKNIFIDDMFDFAQLLISEFGEAFDPDEGNLKVDLVDTTLGVKVGSVSPSEHRLSTEFKLKGSANITVKQITSDYTFIIPFNVDININNLKLAASYSLLYTDENLWVIQPAYIQNGSLSIMMYCIEEYIYYLEQGEPEAAREALDYFLSEVSGMTDLWLLSNDKQWSIDIAAEASAVLPEGFEVDLAGDLSGHYNYSSVDDYLTSQIFVYVFPFILFTSNYLSYTSF